MSDLQRRSMDRWRDLGYLVYPVEHRKRFPAKGALPCRLCKALKMVDIAVDMFNAFDLLAITLNNVHGNLILMQVTDKTHFSNRRNKILGSPEAKLCMLAGVRILLETWDKVSNRWRPEEHWFEIDEFPVELPVSVEEFYEAQRKAKLPELPAGVTLFSPIQDEDLPF